jgi:hypothetical protein
MPSNSGHALDTAGNIRVDFVWGNFPGQPNDLRTTNTDTVTATVGADPVTNGSKRLVPRLDKHDDILGGWNGYPGYTPNDKGEFTGTAYNYTPFIVVPNVLGLALADAKDGLRDSGYQDANIKVNGTDQPNAGKSITNIARTSGSTEVSITATGATAAYPVGTKITVASTGTVDGTWIVTGNSSTNVVKFQTPGVTSALSSGTGSVVAVAGTIFSQSVAPNADSITGTADITITKYATAS